MHFMSTEPILIGKQCKLCNFICNKMLLMGIILFRRVVKHVEPRLISVKFSDLNAYIVLRNAFWMQYCPINIIQKR